MHIIRLLTLSLIQCLCITSGCYDHVASIFIYLLEMVFACARSRSYVLANISFPFRKQTCLIDHLHGIDNITEDAFAAHSPRPYSTNNGDGQSKSGSEDRVCVANVEMLEGEVEKRVVREGGVLSRGTRYSLTCRDVGRVASVGTGKIFGRR